MNQEIISNAFNNFFIDIGPKLVSKIQHNYFDYLNKPAQTCISAKPIVPKEIVKIISKFNPNKSLGHGGKNVASEIS